MKRKLGWGWRHSGWGPLGIWEREHEQWYTCLPRISPSVQILAEHACLLGSDRVHPQSAQLSCSRAWSGRAAAEPGDRMLGLSWCRLEGEIKVLWGLSMGLAVNKEGITWCKMRWPSASYDFIASTCANYLRYKYAEVMSSIVAVPLWKRVILVKWPETVSGKDRRVNRNSEDWRKLELGSTGSVLAVRNPRGMLSTADWCDCLYLPGLIRNISAAVIVGTNYILVS